MSKIKPNSYNGWDPLKQVILGNCYTPDFFDDVKDKKLRHLLQKLLYETQEDLKGFKRMLTEAGVDVLQYPENTSVLDVNRQYENINDLYEDQRNQNWNGWLTKRGGIPKPMIAPRDQIITYGDKLSLTGVDFQTKKYFIDNDWISEEDFDTRLLDSHIEMRKSGKEYSGPLEPSQYMFEERNYNWKKRNIPGTIEYQEFRNMSWGYQAPSVTRVGDTLVVDQIEVGNLSSYLKSEYPQFKHCNVALGGHNDGVFCPVKPGHIITTDEKTDYSDTFPGWDVHVIQDPQNAANVGKFNNQKIKTDGSWWTPESNDNPEYVDFVQTWLKEWVGWVEETVFEVNMLVINPELVFCTNYNKGVFDYLESIGVEPVIMPFRHRFFWDSGLHCLTLDTQREGGMQNYFE